MDAQKDFLKMYDDVLVPEDLQSILHIGKPMVYKCLREGTIPSLRIGGKYLIPKWYLYDYMYPDRSKE